VEDIRQSIIQQDEKMRIEADSKPKAKKTHEPGQPIPLPQIGGRGGDEVGPGAPTPVNPGAPAPAVPGPRRQPKGGAGTAPRMIER
jgi:hypothetical protein